MKALGPAWALNLGGSLPLQLFCVLRPENPYLVPPDSALIGCTCFGIARLRYGVTPCGALGNVFSGWVVILLLQQLPETKMSSYLDRNITLRDLVNIWNIRSGDSKQALMIEPTPPGTFPGLGPFRWNPAPSPRYSVHERHG